MASKYPRSSKNEEPKSAEEIKPLNFKSKIKNQESKKESQTDQIKNKYRESQASTTTKQLQKQDTNKKSVGHTGMMLKQRVNKSSTIKQFNAVASSKQINENKSSTVKKPLSSEVSLKQNKEKLECSSGGTVTSKFKTTDKSNKNLNPAKKTMKSPSENLPPELCHTFLEYVPEDFMLEAAVKNTSHKGIKFIPNTRRKSTLSFTLNTKSKEISGKSNDLTTVAESSTPNETKT